MRGSTQRTGGLALVVLSLALLCVTGVASAQAGVQNVRYRGYVVTIPRSWPVYDLARDPSTCVRFDRHALYLGTPSTSQRCPAHAAGRTEAILLAPLARRSPRSATALPATDGHATTFATSGVLITATWSRGHTMIERALHRRALPAPPKPILRRTTRSPRAAHSAATIYNGLGFDACAAPSQNAMTAWGSSPYRAVGVYIGGVNSACAQPNLTPTWVSTQVANGWHLIPTYVGLQAPSNDCGCASITPSQASAEGTAAASDAVTNAQAIGLPAGNPIYDDMEGYSRSSTNTSAVLAFLSAWTSQLHAEGYASGVYSSAGSGISDLVSQWGTSYLEPDEIWIADWNGQQSTDDAYVPSTEWSNQQRLHQYQGAHDETYGGATINIDNDYLDGATADTATGSLAIAEPTTPPSLTLAPQANGTTNVSASWSGAYGVKTWRVFAGFDSTGASLGAIAQAPAKSAVTQIAVHNGAPYFAVQALGSSGQVLGTSPPTAMPPHLSLFGPTTFVPVKGGLGGIPVGCYTGAACRIKLTLTAGRALLASTGSEYIGPGSGGLVYYRLTSKGRKLLARVRSNRFIVRATVRDVSGATATMKVSLIGISTSGRAPARHATQAPTLAVMSTWDYVSSRGVGGILTACRNTPVCHITTTLKVGKVVIAQTGAEYLGANELGYLIFTLNSRGKRLLRNARGNQLGAQLSITDGDTTATARIVLVGFI